MVRAGTGSDSETVIAFRAEERKAERGVARLLAAGGVADPARGTAVAVGYAALALAAASLWISHHGAGTGLHPAWLAVLLLAAAFAERIGLELGPRSWYSPSAPVILAAALLGGPLAGLAAGAAAQFLRLEVVWRRRLAEGGLASLQGFAAGAAAAGVASTSAGLAAAAAVSASLAVMTVGRALIIAQRRIPGAARLWLRGTVVDVVEAVLLVPLLTTLALAARTSEAAVVGTIASLLAAVALAERLRARYGEALARERANARRDELTGAPNRRAFEELLAAEHARIVRGARPAALFLVDIDSFKAVNDRYGHAIGDEALAAVIARLAAGLRAGDTVARWGGEELTVLAPGLDVARDVERFAERLRRVVSDPPLELGPVSLDLTVSVGATLLDGSLTPERALRRADAALYDAKETRDAVALRLPPASPRPGAARLQPALERARQATGTR
jgi:diguanylate cyclase (GGDEF)-like protein